MTIDLDYKPNAAYYGDCADIMTAWKNKGVQGIIDLIYADPPFNSNRNYGAPTSKAKDSDTGSLDAFVDMWTYNHQSVERVDRICDQLAHPAHYLIKGLKEYLLRTDPGMLAYLSYMADRLWLCHGLLKETGSIYLHCDPTASHYLKMLMDSIFGAENFRREITWQMKSVSGFKSKTNNWVRDHDTILYYVKNFGTQTFNKEILPYRKEYIHKMFTKVDEDGRRYRQRAHRRYYADEGGMPAGDVWTDIYSMQTTTQSKEWRGYPTQKPLPLLDRIIKASSNAGDVVLDPFCGCGTTIHSAINHKRKYIGIDQSVFSIHSVTKDRISEECGIDIPIFGIPTNLEGARLLAKQDKFAFEAWAAETLNFGDIGILSNKIKRCDGGIDGKGLLWGQNEFGQNEVIVQVKGGSFDFSDVRAFARVIQKHRDKVAAGIFITLDGKGWTEGMEEEARSLGTFKMPNGNQRFRVMQHWPVKDRFKNGGEGEYPKMPIMINPLNGRPLVDIGTTISKKPPMPIQSKTRSLRPCQNKRKNQADFLK